MEASGGPSAPNADGSGTGGNDHVGASGSAAPEPELISRDLVKGELYDFLAQHGKVKKGDTVFPNLLDDLQIFKSSQKDLAAIRKILNQLQVCNEQFATRADARARVANLFSFYYENEYGRRLHS